MNHTLEISDLSLNGINGFIEAKFHYENWMFIRDESRRRENSHLVHNGPRDAPMLVELIKHRFVLVVVNAR